MIRCFLNGIILTIKWTRLFGWQGWVSCHDYHLRMTCKDCPTSVWECSICGKLKAGDGE